MRIVYAHETVLDLAADVNSRIPQARIAAALDGTPHHIAAEREGDRVWLRTLFAAEPGHDEEIRDRIDEAAAESIDDAAAGTIEWQVVRSACTRIVERDREPARRLLKAR